jgi:hypothetical protein
MLASTRPACARGSRSSVACNLLDDLIRAREQPVLNRQASQDRDQLGSRLPAGIATALVLPGVIHCSRIVDVPFPSQYSTTIDA